MELYIAHEVDNPLEMFFYTPVSMSTNLLKVRLLEGKKVDLEKDYTFYYNRDGINFSFVGRPIKKVGEDTLLVLIKDSRIELRRYPRVKVPFDEIVVEVDGLKGFLRDISLGGCRLQFLKPIPSDFLDRGLVKRVRFFLPDGQTFEVKAKVVNIMRESRSVSCAFVMKDETVVKLYKAVTLYLRRRLGLEEY
ncbi:MAG: PilZ domain-containing protein [Aquificae bacterium]|nr:PilZ domain-containing protein [Aquificota bacterium]